MMYLSAQHVGDVLARPSRRESLPLPGKPKAALGVPPAFLGEKTSLKLPAAFCAALSGVQFGAGFSLEEMLREKSRDAYDELSEWIGDYAKDPQFHKVQEKLKILRPGHDQDMLDRLLMHAMSVHDSLLIKTLLKAGANPNVDRTYSGDRKNALERAIDENNGDAVCLLVRAGAKLTRLGRSQTPPYLYALGKERPVLADLLESLGADIYQCDENDKNALFYWATLKRADKVQRLLTQGMAADGVEVYSHRPLLSYLLPFVPPEDPLIDLWLEKVRQTPLLNQCRDSLLQDILLPNAFEPPPEHMLGWIQRLGKAGVNLTDPLSTGMTVGLLAARSGNLPLVQWLHESGVDLSLTGKDGVNMATQAAYSWQVPLIHYLKEQRFPLDVPDDGGQTPLMKAISRTLSVSQIKQFPSALQEDMVKTLIEAGADVNHADKNGLTPLMLAAKWRPKLIGPLVSAGARLDVMDKNGRTPLSHASRINCDETFELLRAHGAQPRSGEQHETRPGEIPQQFLTMNDLI